MRRVGSLFAEIIAFPNLLVAARAAARGKRFKPEPAAFHFDLESNLLRLLARKIKCPDTLELLGVIIEASAPQEPITRYFSGDDLFAPHERRRGIPIGNLTSQLFGNIMLNLLDHLLKEQKRRQQYLRYADDLLVFGSDKAELHSLLLEMREFLYAYRLTLQPRKCVLMRVADGVPFLGWRIYPDHRRLRRSTGVRFQRGLRRLTRAYSTGEVGCNRVRASLASWIGHLKHGDTFGLRKKLLRSAVFSASNSEAVEGVVP